MRNRRPDAPSHDTTSTPRTLLIIALIFVLTIALLIAAGALGLLDRDQPSDETGAEVLAQSGPVEATVPTPDPAQTPPLAAVATAEPEPASWDGGSFAPSLAGTDIDGKLEADDQGYLKVSIDVKDFFDYFLSAVGERSVDEVLAMLHQQIDQRLPPEAAAQARMMLQNYIDYQHAMADMMGQPMVAQDQSNVQQTYDYYAQTMEQTFEQLKALRRQYFGPQEVDAFFSLEEAYGEYALTAMKLNADDSLTPPAREAALKEAERILPAQMIEAEAQARKQVALSDATVELFEQGRSPEDIKSILAQRYPDQFDPEATESVVNHLANEAVFEQRMQSYLDQKAALLADGVSEADASATIEALQARTFDEAELPRVAAVEAIARKTAQQSAASQ
ncbi:lipase secretion chaperone [Allohahella marinimesophila]|uniref:Lipase chaperone n=1 Tax=Allohahella marinimesophila TaxID=1054972 RepID=A0ABP7P5Q0_9GAMM